MTSASERNTGRALSRSEMMARIRQLAARRNVHALSPRQLERATGITLDRVRRHFDSHQALVDACNLQADPRSLRAFAHDAKLAARHQRAETHRPDSTAWKSCGGPRVGAPLNFHGLQDAPTNEMGVVYLFGALAPSLGYLVESLGVRFPDCIARRRLSEPGEPWERVRIEFEFRSRNFAPTDTMRRSAT